MERKRPANPLRPIPGANRWEQPKADDDSKPKRKRGRPRKQASKKADST